VHTIKRGVILLLLSRAWLALKLDLGILIIDTSLLCVSWALSLMGLIFLLAILGVSEIVFM